MQTLYQNKDKKYISEKTSTVDFIVCTERIGRYLEGKYNRSLEYVTIGEFFINLKKEFGSGNDESVKVIDLKKIK